MLSFTQLLGIDVSKYFLFEEDRSMKTYGLIQSYYLAFNNRDLAELLKTLHPEVTYDTFLGETKTGFDAFKKHMEFCFECVKETIHDLIILSSNDDQNAAAKFICDGEYVKTITGYPEACNQKYSVECYTFFELRDDLIYRVTSYFNEKNWLAQLAA